MTKNRKVGKPGIQYDQFVAAAKSLECDESEEHFDEALKKVARHKPANEPQAEKPERKEPAK